jgi:hypothetical protein
VRRLVLAVLLGLLPGLAGCSTVPMTSATVQIPRAGERPAPDVGIEPLSPEPGATPEEIVRGFVDAAASTTAGHPVAREHLTAAAAETWSDEGRISVISADYSTVATAEGRVQLSAELIGTVDARGVFTVNSGGSFVQELSLEEVDGEWRIANPPNGLIMLQLDFERLYDRLMAYFLDPTGTRLVPDPRYLITGDAQPTVLLDRVLEGPSAPLAAGVRTMNGEVTLNSAVAVTGQEAVVDLTGLGSDPASVLPGISAQIVWTLQQLDIRSVQIRVDGDLVRLPNVPLQQTVDDWASYNPNAVPVDAVGHYIDNGAVRVATTGEPSPGPAGTGAYGLISAAAKTDADTGQPVFLAGVRPIPGGQQLVAGPYDGELGLQIAGVRFTAPTVAATRPEVWAVRETTDRTTIIRVQAGAGAQEVQAETLAGLGRVEVLQLSPDGVRAAVVADGALYVGTVVRTEDGPVALRDFRPIAPTLSQVRDVTWRDSEELLVLADNDPIAPHVVGVDGWGVDDVSVSGLPGEPTSIAAAPSRQPLASVANGTIWQLSGGTWETLERGALPLPGTAPFFPL